MMYPVPFPTLTGKEAAWLGVIFVVLVSIIFGAIFREASKSQERAEARAVERVEARDLWLSRCEDGLARCTRQWDNTRSLRDIHIDEVRRGRN